MLIGTLYLMKIGLWYATSCPHCLRRGATDHALSDKPMTLPTLKIKYLIGPRIVLGPFFNYEFRLSEALYSFSMFLESIATLPQSLSL